MVWIVNAKITGPYEVNVEFNDGTQGTIHFKKILEKDSRKKVRELLDQKIFETMKVDLDTLCWDNGVDFAPEYIYKIMKLKKGSAREGAELTKIGNQ